MRPTPLGGPDRLAVDNGGTGRGLAPGLPSHPFPQRGMDALPSAIQSPFPKIGVDRGPRPVIPWQHPPLATAAQDGEDSIQDDTQVDGSWAPAWLGRRQQWSQDGPFLLAQFRGVEGSRHETPPCTGDTSHLTASLQAWRAPVPGRLLSSSLLRQLAICARSVLETSRTASSACLRRVPIVQQQTTRRLNDAASASQKGTTDDTTVLQQRSHQPRRG